MKPYTIDQLKNEIVQYFSLIADSEDEEKFDSVMEILMTTFNCAFGINMPRRIELLTHIKESYEDDLPNYYEVIDVIAPQLKTIIDDINANGLTEEKLKKVMQLRDSIMDKGYSPLVQHTPGMPPPIYDFKSFMHKMD